MIFSSQILLGEPQQYTWTGVFSKAVMLSATKAIVNTENFGPKKKEKKEEKEEMPSIQKVNR